MYHDTLTTHSDVISDPLILDKEPNVLRRSPIFVTIADPKITHVDFQKLLEAGTNIIRFKTFHCSIGDNIKLLSKVDKATAFLCDKYSVGDWPCTTCLELKTCIVTTGILEGKEEYITIKEGTYITLTYDLNEFDKCNANIIFVDNPYIAVDTEVGMRISITQDEIELQCVRKINDHSIRCLVTKTGKLRNMTTLVVKTGNNSSPLLDNKDLKIIKFAMQYQVDMIIINYIRYPETIVKAKEFIGKIIKRPIIIAGICTKEAIKYIDDIIKEADGIMFSRDALAYELDESLRYRLLLIQKWIGAKCLQAGKPFYISGDIFAHALDTGEFVDNESVDVTNAILDGATGFVLEDCNNIEVMLYVLQAINALCCTVEPLMNTKNDFYRVMEEMRMPVTAAEACAISCVAVAYQCNAKAIVIPTVTGDTVELVLALRPGCLLITVSGKTETTRKLQSLRCVVPLIYKGPLFRKWEQAMKDRVLFAIDHAVNNEWLHHDDFYVTLRRGSYESAFCDTVRIWNIKTYKKTLMTCQDGGEETSK